jgi:ribosomal protein S18 acetylase RimI-like enzyme
MRTQIDRFRAEDVEAFLSLAGAEGWICDSWEFAFLLRSFPEGCLAARLDGAPVAFVTSVKYERSGWIGNLIVRPELRGRGIGAVLMERAMAALVEAGAKTVWLTASAAGRPIYERLGFTAVDTIKRWRGQGSGAGGGEQESCAAADLLALDRAGWGDTRGTILAEVVKRGAVSLGNGAFLVSQPSAAGLQLGPWGATGREEALRVFDAAAAQAGEGVSIFLDVPVRNVVAAAILHCRGFTISGSNALMCLGEKPAYDPSRIYALASMGSMG